MQDFHPNYSIQTVLEEQPTNLAKVKAAVQQLCSSRAAAVQQLCSSRAAAVQ